MKLIFCNFVDYSLRSFGFCQNRDCGKKKSAPTSTESRSQSVLSNIVLFTILSISKQIHTYLQTEPNLRHPNWRINMNLGPTIFNLLTKLFNIKETKLTLKPCKFLLLTIDITFDWFALLWLVKISVDGQNSNEL